MRSASSKLLSILVLWGAGCEAPRNDPVPLVIVPFTFAHGLVFLEVEWPGRKSLLALLDTGANASAIDSRCAGDVPVLERSEVLGTTGTIEAEMVKVEGLLLGIRPLPALRASRRDLSGLLPLEGRAVDMILGSDAFLGSAVTLDYPRSRIEIAPSVEATPEGVPMILDEGIPAIEGEIGGIPVWLRIDTGASLFDTRDVYVNIPTHLWEELRHKHPEIEPSTHFQGAGADGRAVDLPVAEIADARIGPMELERVFIIVQPTAGYFARSDAKGFVSNNFLRKLGRVTLDYPSRQLRQEK